VPDREPDIEDAAAIVAALTATGRTVAVAESLTGGLLVAALVAVPGASATLLGGVVAYNTALKHNLLGVDERLLARHGAVHPEVAAAMAAGVRRALAVDGRAADIGIATTGVAGPDEQDGTAVGTVFIGIAFDDEVHVIPLHLGGDRAAIRSGTVSESLSRLRAILAGERRE
jgi:nicotinamide-nucleotide amidase